MVAGCTSLKTVYWNKVSLHDLPDNLFESCGGLNDVSIKGNYITELKDDVFKRSAKLESLDLSDNDLKELGSRVFR